jgi:hypothetical protein
MIKVLRKKKGKQPYYKEIISEFSVNWTQTQDSMQANYRFWH